MSLWSFSFHKDLFSGVVGGGIVTRLTGVRHGALAGFYHLLKVID